MEVDERHKICQLIESMLAADGTISPIERDFLRRVVERFGLPDREGVPFSDSAESDVGRSTNALRSRSAWKRCSFGFDAMNIPPKTPPAIMSPTNAV